MATKTLTKKQKTDSQSLPISQIACKKWTKFFAGELVDIPSQRPKD